VNSSGRLFLTFSYVLLISGSIWMVMLPKGTMVLWLNAHYTDFLNIFFTYFTYLGDGILIGILILVLLAFRFSWSGMMTFMGLLQLLVVQGLKKFVFGPMERPASFFENALPPLNIVEGVDVHHLFTMPSGHTTTAFSIAFILVLIFNPGAKWTTTLFVSATLVGLSRIYLAQHFLIDSLVGCVLGMLLAFTTFKVFEMLRNKNPESGFFNRSLRSSKN